MPLNVHSIVQSRARLHLIEAVGRPTQWSVWLMTFITVHTTLYLVEFIISLTVQHPVRSPIQGSDIDLIKCLRCATLPHYERGCKLTSHVLNPCTIIPGGDCITKTTQEERGVSQAPLFITSGKYLICHSMT